MEITTLYIIVTMLIGFGLASELNHNYKIETDRPFNLLVKITIILISRLIVPMLIGFKLAEIITKD